MNIGAIGVLEINFYTNALILLDAMLKNSEVFLVRCDKTLGGRMVHLIVGGSVSQVNEALLAAQEVAKALEEGTLKVAIPISAPHPEVLRFLGILNKTT